MPGGERDPFRKRDPGYIERTLPALRLSSKLYFRADVRGLENIPPEGPVLLVGNHSGGTWIADTFVFSQSFYDHFGAERRFHQLAHDLVFKVPGLRALVERYGTVPASPENMARALRAMRRCSCTPAATTRRSGRAGNRTRSTSRSAPGSSSSRSSTRSRSSRWSSIGGQETALFLGQGRRVARALQLDRRLRLKVLPPVIGPPFGLTILDLPGRFPLPAKISIRVRQADRPARAPRPASPTRTTATTWSPRPCSAR